MILTAFTLVHVLISLVGIIAGFVVLYGLVNAKLLRDWNTAFLSTTVLTSITGFLFPVKHFMPSQGVGIVSLTVLAIALYALHGRHLKGGWRRTYVITATMALYLNVFVGVVQSFTKIPALKLLAPTQTEGPFKIAQLSLLIIFIFLGTLAANRFREKPLRTGVLS
ncbi:MAG TPA: hypothetical protein VIS96_04755 [Terrimicrobiaceae bacterium]